MTRVLSLGAGVQSSAMLLMALEGRFGDKPDIAIFADTQWEPADTYRWLDELTEIVAPFPIIRVTKGDMRAAATTGLQTRKGTKRFIALPFHVRKPDGKHSIAPRHCTEDYKLRAMRSYLWKEGIRRIESWIGISLDEADRMKPSRLKSVKNRYPLIDARLRWSDCQEYLIDRVGHPVSKSSCIGCPFHDDNYWGRMRAESPAEFADAVAFDLEIRHGQKMVSERFLHRSCVPLGDIKEFRNEFQGRFFVDMFGNECEGVCGT
jgi:hypothetical protein